MLPSANISIAVATMRLGELVNRGLTASARTASSHNARNTSIDSVPSRRFSLRRQADRRGAAGVSMSVMGAVAVTIAPSGRRYHAGARRLLLDQAPDAPLQGD